MPKTVGVDPGDALVKVVELDGSYRKLRLLQVHTAPVDAGLPKTAVVAAAVRDAVDAGMKGDVFLGYPCREAVLRTIELPFKGKDALRKVVKSEVENEIHGYAVDDMVVAFHEVEGAAEGGSRVLVAAMPKSGLRAQLDAFEAAAIEPQTIDLDTMALWRAADWAGAFESEDGDEAAQGDRLTAVVDIGARSVKVLLVVGDELVDMRALRLGEAAIGDDIAMRHGLSVEVAREAVQGCIATGAPVEVEVAAEVPATTEGNEEEAAAVDGEDPAGRVQTRAVSVAPAEVDAARIAFLQRLHRELVRYLASSGRGDVDAVWITGGACRTAGIEDVLAEAFGTAPRELDLLAGLQHDLEDDEVAELGPQLAVAIGCALAPMGGPQGLDLRREDLAYTKGFERIKFPLTITLMVGLLALFVYTNHRAAVRNNLEYEIGKTHYGPGNKIDFFGMVNSVLAGKWFEKPSNFLYEKSRGKDYRWKDLRDELVNAPVHERIKLLRNKLKAVADDKQEKSGIYEEVALESGYAVFVRFSEIMQQLEPQLGRYLLTRFELNMPSQNRYLSFAIACRGSGFRDKGAALERAFQAEFARPDSPFMPPKNKQLSTEKLFVDSDETGVAGAYFEINLGIKEAFGPFGGGASVGGQ